jgi:hypothetical protein
MNAVRITAGLVALALLVGCGTTTSSTSSTHQPAHGTSCVRAGSVQPADPVVQVKTTSQGLHTISHVTTVGCSDWVQVHGTMSAANLTFAPKAKCQLSEIEPGQPALMQIRNPLSVLFTLEPGQVLCFFGRPQAIPLCGTGAVYPGGGSSGLIECSDPLFRVKVYSGTMRVRTPGNQACMVTASNQVTYDFAARQPELAKTGFSKAQIRLFFLQADELGMAVVPRSSSSPPHCAPV